jgi:uncharacterized protein (UPF0333 family)
VPGCINLLVGITFVIVCVVVAGIYVQPCFLASSGQRSDKGRIYMHGSSVNLTLLLQILGGAYYYSDDYRPAAANKRKDFDNSGRVFERVRAKTILYLPRKTPGTDGDLATRMHRGVIVSEITAG